MTVFLKATEAKKKADEAAQAVQAVGLDGVASVRLVNYYDPERDRFCDGWDARVAFDLDDAHELARQKEGS